MGTQDRRFGSVWTIDDAVEIRRLSLQEKLDLGKTIEERRRLGQFATPTALARDIVSFGLKHIDSQEGIRFFDPAFGTGAFYSALLQEADGDNIINATAVEIDPLFTNVASNLWPEKEINIVNADFTAIEPDSKYNLIICNPPYVRHHLIEGGNKVRIKDKTEKVSGVKLSGLAGLYCHFLLQSIQWMDDDAVAGWLITPADNYDNLFILWFRLDFRVFNFIMVKNFFNF
ncbi:MAG: hypothetical protein LBP22_12440 [Deltaproteobacteria bacterium]|jgi:methylase of polypeptide subunit release factors|nr:hypothetical protein [Deltaproteobacteria bacterium]